MMKNKVGQLSGVEKLLELESTNRSLVEEKKMLTLKVKEMKKAEILQGQQLKKLTKEEDYVNKTQQLTNELRAWKDKVQKLE